MCLGGLFRVSAPYGFSKNCGMGDPFCPTDGSRRVFWNELNSIATYWNKPWVVGGDFNVIRLSEESNVRCPIASFM